MLALESPKPELTPLQQAEAELVRLAAEFAQERAISARFLVERDEGIRVARLESPRVAAELATERAIVARLFQERQGLLDRSRQHVVLSSYIGDYTSAVLDGKSASERAALLEAIRVTTKVIWDSGVSLGYLSMVKMIRTMMAPHGFVFREPGEGKTAWEGYATNVPEVGAVEQLDRLVRTRRAGFGVEQWYSLQLTSVLCRIGEYLEEHP